VYGCHDNALLRRQLASGKIGATTYVRKMVSLCVKVCNSPLGTAHNSCQDAARGGGGGRDCIRFCGIQASKRGAPRSELLCAVSAATCSHSSNMVTLNVNIWYTVTLRLQRVLNDDNNLILHVRFEVLTTVTMKNVVFWDIKTQFVTHRRHIKSPLQCPAG
jgi:hypothetical protein